jgi:hypothetical protein
MNGSVIANIISHILAVSTPKFIMRTFSSKGRLQRGLRITTTTHQFHYDELMCEDNFNSYRYFLRICNTYSLAMILLKEVQPKQTFNTYYLDMAILCKSKQSQTLCGHHQSRFRKRKHLLLLSRSLYETLCANSATKWCPRTSVTKLGPFLRKL